MSNMMRCLVERAARVVFDVSLMFVRNPNLRIRSEVLKFKQEGDLTAISKQYCIKVETLRRQLETGLANPAYGFHRDESFFQYFVSPTARFRGCSWLDVGTPTGAVSLVFD
jgi:hypothetical protein